MDSVSRAETLETSDLNKLYQDLIETNKELVCLEKSYPDDHPQILALREKFDGKSKQLHKKNLQEIHCLKKVLQFVIGLLLNALNIRNHAWNEGTEQERIHHAEISAEMNEAKAEAVQAKQDRLEERGKHLQTVSAKNQMILNAQGRISELLDIIGVKNQLLLASQLFGRGLVALLRWSNQEHLKTKLRCFGLEGELVKTQDHLKKEIDTLRAENNSLRRDINGEQADDENQEDQNHANGESHGARRV